MRALVSHAPGLDGLSLDERETPRPGPGQVLLRMRAAAVTLRDCKMAAGAYGAEDRGPLVLGGEGVGEIVECGRDVAGWRIGQRVNPLFVQGWTGERVHVDEVATTTLGGPRLDGTFAQFMLASAASLVEVPAHLGDAEAATLPFAGLTAWCAVQGVGPGDTVVVQGTGGIPLFALQFARLAGARVIVSSKSDEKLERARALGADHTFNYQAQPDWHRTVLELTEGRGADRVLDPGGSVTIAQSLRALRPGGTASVFNALGSAEIEVSLPWLLGHNLRVRGVNAGSLAAHRAMAAAIGESGLRPVLECVLPFEAAADAVAAAPRREQFGKVCLQMTA
jgi:NADPH:quinone reductase-like Zn-dependent oxidoreductase